MNRYSFNLNSLLFRIIVYVLYAILTSVFYFLLKYILQMFHIENNFVPILLFFIVVCIGIIHKKDYRNQQLFCFIFNLPFKIKNFIIQNLYLLIEKLMSFIAILFCLFCAYCICIGKLPNVGITEKEIFNLASIITTVVSIILTSFYAVFQNFSNKFVEIQHITRTLKCFLIFSFFVLFIYVLVGILNLTNAFHGTFNTWLTVASVYILLNMFLLGVQIFTLYDEKSILYLYSKKIKNSIDCLPKIDKITSENIDNYMETYKKTSIWTKIKVDIFGIIKKYNYKLDEQYIKSLIEKLDPFYRIALAHVKANNINAFKNTLIVLLSTIVYSLPKMSNGDNFSYFEYIATKTNEVFSEICKLNYQYFLESIVEFNANIAVNCVQNARKLPYACENQHDYMHIRLFVDNAKNFAINSINMEHSIASSLAIDSLFDIFVWEINNEDLSGSVQIYEKYCEIVSVLDSYYTQNKITEISKFTFFMLINKILSHMISLLLQLVLYSYKKKDIEAKEQAKNICMRFYTVYVLINKYNATCFDNKSHFINVYDNGAILNTYAEVILGRTRGKYDYSNILLNSNEKAICKVNTFADIFSCLCIQDLTEDSSFEYAFDILNTIIILVSELYKFDIQESVKKYGMYDSYYCDFIIKILDLIAKFYKRIKKCKYKLAENSEIFAQFYAKIFQNLIRVLEIDIQEEKTNIKNIDYFTAIIFNLIDCNDLYNEIGCSEDFILFIKKYLSNYKNLKSNKEEYYQEIYKIALHLWKNDDNKIVSRLFIEFLKEEKIVLNTLNENQYYIKSINSKSIDNYIKKLAEDLDGFNEHVFGIIK